MLTHGDGHRNWGNKKSVIVTQRLMEARRGTGAAERILPLSHNSPFHEHVYSAWAGGEENEAQKVGCERIAAMITDVSANGITIDAPASATGQITFGVSFVVGGDYPWLAASLGLVGHQSSCPCVWCDVKSSDLGHVRPQMLDAPGFVTPRTQAEQSARAHLFGDAGGRCKCGTQREKTFTSDADAKRKFAALSATAKKDFSKNHFGTYFQQGYGTRRPGHETRHGQTTRGARTCAGPSSQRRRARSCASYTAT